MRPIRLGPFSPITALATAFNAGTFNSTGAATAVTTTATTDGLAHQVTLVAPVQATLAGVTFTVVGTDPDGNAKTETGLVGPASGATVTSTGYFKTVSTIQPSATMGALVVSVGCAAPSLTPTIPLEWRSSLAATHEVVVTGTINWSVQQTFNDVYNGRAELSTWASSVSGLTAQTGNALVVGTVGTCGVRFLTNSVTNGATFTWRLVQPTQQTG